MDFCDDVDAIFTTKGIDKDPLHKVPQIDRTIIEPIKSVPVEFTEEENELLIDLLRSYQIAFRNKRLHMKPLFEDFDITKIGYVTKNQFTRLLKQEDLIPNNERQFNLLLKKYMDKGNLNEVNYYQFIRDIDQYNEDSKTISKNYADSFIGFRHEPRVSNATISNETPQDLNDLLGRIGRKVKEERIRVSDFLRDFDKLRHGNISKQQFRLALNMAKLPLSESEFTLILNNFECENKPGFIRWKDFTDTIDKVFNQRNLEKVSPNQPVELAKTDFLYTRPQITEAEKALAEKIKG
jgi:Ca2+-binding EF-hand superfamily protein